jgi:hypothetical protein
MNSTINSTISVQFTFEDAGKELASFTLTTGGEDVAKEVTVPGVGKLELSIKDDPETARVVKTGSCQSVFCGESRVSAYAQSLCDLLPEYEGLPANLTVKASASPAPLAKRPKHPEGKVCEDCLLFDASTGQEHLRQETHTFAEGAKGHMHKDIINAMASTYGRPTISEGTVGYCPKHSDLCAKTTPACMDGFEEK